MNLYFRGFDFGNHFCEWSCDYSCKEYPYYSYHPEDYPSVQRQVRSASQQSMYCTNDYNLLHYHGVYHNTCTNCCHVVFLGSMNFFTIIWRNRINIGLILWKWMKKLLSSFTKRPMFLPWHHIFSGVFGLLFKQKFQTSSLAI